MPLSEHEQRMLEEIESALYAEDPKFATSVRKTSSAGPRRVDAKVIAVAVLGAVVLVGGLAVPIQPGGFPVVSLVGFLILFVAGIMVIRGSGKASEASGSADSEESELSSSKTKGAGRGSGGATRPGPKPAGGNSGGSRGPSGGQRGGSNRGQSFQERMEERFRKRFDEGEQF